MKSRIIISSDDLRICLAGQFSLFWDWKYPVFGVCVHGGMDNGMHNLGF